MNKKTHLPLSFADRSLCLPLTLAAGLALSACGGGGGGTGVPDTTQPVLSGVVAVGAALPSTTVVVIDANGTKVTATTASDGAYEITDPPGLTLKPPFSVKVNTQLGQSEVSMTSLALGRGDTANVTPLTTATAALLNAGGNYDPATLVPATVTTASLATASGKLAAAMTPILEAAGVPPGSFNPVTAKFSADRTGIDSVLDRLSVDIAPTGVGLVNRFQLSSDAGGATTDPTAKVVVTSAGASGTLPLGLAPPSPAMVARLEAAVRACFAIPAAQRVRYSTNPTGRQIFEAGSLHASCAKFVHAAYRSQGMPFGQSWLYLLANEDLDANVKLALVPQYVVDRTGAARWQGTDDNYAYVYNINLIDKNGLSFTKPEVLAKINNEFIVRGNQRRFDVMVQPMFTKVNDNNGTNNYVEGRLRIAIDPHLIPPAGADTLATYGSYQLAGDRPLPKLLCAWVTGPLLQNGVTHDPSRPKGGVLMVPPHSDLTARRDYSAVRIKYPEGFDPTQNATDRAQLLKDCRDYPHNAGLGNSIRWELGSAETNSAFTIDGAKTDASSSTEFVAYKAAINGGNPNANASVAYPTSLSRTSCPLSSNSSADRTAVSGWCAPTKRDVLVTDALRTAFETTYKDPKDVIYTFYLFVDQTYAGTGPQTVSADAKTAYTGFNANGDDFLASAEIVQARIVGAMPFVDKASGVYAGNQVFRGVGAAMVSAYLGANLSTLAKGSLIQGSWTIPDGVEGIDRLGISGWFINTAGSRIGAATFSDSFALPRSVKTKDFALTEDWYGFDFSTYKNQTYATVAAKAYREIWVRSYDTRNRQIQTVENAVR
ncbi:MAG: carboxypeptidase regulatory-like domain-containing protein [Betaproteobacteria bacterium]|nr:carboxypeptidase regulatory-like domain-containing protein [Betaproteobacteria bacterium]